MKRAAPGRDIDPLSILVDSEPIIRANSAELDLADVSKNITWYAENRITGPVSVLRLPSNVSNAPIVGARNYVEQTQPLTLLEIGPKDKPLHVWLRRAKRITVVNPGGGNKKQNRLLAEFIAQMAHLGHDSDVYEPDIRRESDQGSVLSATIALLAQDAGMCDDTLHNRLLSSEDRTTMQFLVQKDMKTSRTRPPKVAKIDLPTTESTLFDF